MSLNTVVRFTPADAGDDCVVTGVKVPAGTHVQKGMTLFTYIVQGRPKSICRFRSPISLGGFVS